MQPRRAGCLPLGSRRSRGESEIREGVGFGWGVWAWGELQRRSPRSQPNPHVQVHDSLRFKQPSRPGPALATPLRGGWPQPRGDPRTNLNMAPLSSRSRGSPAARQPLLTKLSEPEPRGTRGPPAAPPDPRVRSCPALVTGAGRHPRGHLVRNRWGRKAPGDTPLTWTARPAQRTGKRLGKERQGQTDGPPPSAPDT